YVRPAGLAEALELLATEPDAQLVAGSTDWGVELNIRHTRAALTVGIDRIAELREFTVGRDRIDLGAALSLSEIEDGLGGRVPRWRTRSGSGRRGRGNRSGSAWAGSPPRRSARWPPRKRSGAGRGPVRRSRRPPRRWPGPARR